MKNNKQRIILVVIWVIASIIFDFTLYRLKLGALVMILCILMELINMLLIWKYNPGGKGSIKTVKVSEDGLMGSKLLFYIVQLIFGCVIVNGLAPIWLWIVLIVVLGFSILNRKKLKGFLLRNETSISMFLLAYSTSMVLPVAMVLFDVYVPVFGFSEGGAASLKVKLVLALISITLAILIFPKDSLMARFATWNHANNKLS